MNHIHYCSSGACMHIVSIKVEGSGWHQIDSEHVHCNTYVCLPCHTHSVAIATWRVIFVHGGVSKKIWRNHVEEENYCLHYLVDHILEFYMHDLGCSQQFWFLNFMPTHSPLSFPSHFVFHCLYHLVSYSSYILQTIAWDIPVLVLRLG